jgi:hypothetical protein
MESEEHKKITYSVETIRPMINCASRHPRWKFEVKWGFWNKVWVE